MSTSWPPTAARSTGVTPLAETSRLAIALTQLSRGRTSQMKPREGTPMSLAEVSGYAIAQDFGAISPTTRCRNVTTTSDSTNDSA